MVKKKEIFIFFLLFILSIALLYVYNYTKKTSTSIFENIQKHDIEHISSILKNIEHDFLKSLNIQNSKDMLLAFKNENNRAKYENMLSMTISSNIKYTYVLYKDEIDRFRFILDASKTDKANFYQKFDVEKQEYIDAYKTKKPQIIKQKNMENLYITYLLPIVINNEVIALFSVDISTDLQKYLLESIEPLENFFIVLIWLILLFIFITLMQLFYYFATKKRVFTDPLTNTFNRNYLQELPNVINLNNYSVAMIDLDKFKVINDTYGHDAGDYVLVQASEIFKTSIRASDILIRYGGEEFLLFIHTRSGSALHICERIKENINSKKYFYNNHTINLSVSIGLHNHPALEKNLHEVIKKADNMLYLAKQNGRNRIEVYNEKLNFK
ncbi:GGDEF domain-containing protein [Sulfurimonas sp. CVO]|jgi:diguanylate cyclase (GGDEF)-like protein|uniref:sensor domain-containing diguanylate cyclase n=1 Tax=Sulfurimonas sp. CVO TaxID=2283483 RepID=UPI00132F0569|nr:diguanylate cyclase [Sulfurimonas sp. CVO]QHG90678.1 GGDEF domain-containing protein [Sulfurimonas sp. CVO]